jgi:DNA polymerase elongation subunit (family B)
MKKPRILLYDIETAPNLAYVWGKYDQNVVAFAEERSLLSFSYCWLGEKTIHHQNRQGERDDSYLVASLAALLNEADVSVAHNGDQFDRKVIKTRMLYWGMKPLKPNCSVDTKKAAKNYFSFNGNSLDDLCKYLKIGQKIPTMPFSVWLGCMADKSTDWRIMEKYNNHDVWLLRKVYKRLLPWIENHPTMRTKLQNRPSCSTCQSTSIQFRGTVRKKSQIYRRFQCQQCGKWGEAGRIK